MRLASTNTAFCHVVRNKTFCRWLSFPASTTYRPDFLHHAEVLQPYQPRHRLYPNPDAENIAVLGGGITGLATAYHLAQTVPDAKITIFEKSSRLGGWIDSERVEVEGGDVIFEWGPRSLRPDLGGAGSATQALVRSIFPRWKLTAEQQ